MQIKLYVLFLVVMTLFVVTNDGDYDVVQCQKFRSAHFAKPNGAIVYV